jgi:hypothetical protein
MHALLPRATEFVDGTGGILCFAVWYEVETRSLSEWFDVGNAEKYDLVAA